MGSFKSCKISTFSDKARYDRSQRYNIFKLDLVSVAAPQTEKEKSNLDTEIFYWKKNQRESRITKIDLWIASSFTGSGEKLEKKNVLGLFLQLGQLRQGGGQLRRVSGVSSACNRCE